MLFLPELTTAGSQFDILKKKIREVPHPVASFWRSLVPSHLDCAASPTCELGLFASR
jgi:hypothetical protein